MDMTTAIVLTIVVILYFRFRASVRIMSEVTEDIVATNAAEMSLDLQSRLEEVEKSAPKVRRNAQTTYHKVTGRIQP